METKTTNTIPADYSIGSFTTKTALPLFDMLASSMDFNFPADNAALKSLCEKAISYLDENKLSDTSFYKQLTLKIKNFDILENNTEFPTMKEDNFIHIKKLLAVHSSWIASKLGIMIE
jgi:hypothetical protein